jgi:hypothetical protein
MRQSNNQFVLPYYSRLMQSHVTHQSQNKVYNKFYYCPNYVNKMVDMLCRFHISLCSRH